VVLDKTHKRPRTLGTQGLRHRISLWARNSDCFMRGVQVQVQVQVNLRPTFSRPVRLGAGNPSGTRDQFFSLLEIFFRQLRVCYFVPPSLTRLRVYNLLYNCFWFLPEQSLLGRSPAELIAIFYCFIWLCSYGSQRLNFLRKWSSWAGQSPWYCSNNKCKKKG
jgi:hypothetical protein